MERSMPVYMQIVQDIRLKIASGHWCAGARIPPLRELSVQWGANPNTAQRALSESQREGLLVLREDGPYITEDTQRIEQLKNQMALEFAADYCRQMESLGCPVDEMVRYIKEYSEEGGVVRR